MDETVAAPPTDQLVERWWSDHFPGSVLGHYTEAWNHVFSAKEELKGRLARAFTGTVTASASDGAVAGEGSN